ncbi:MAG: helix-turn-helix domain-containing protein [Clostridia bacterium]|nr:helix-turn-helix domain-containing protein [Clostridia bacterium]
MESKRKCDSELGLFIWRRISESGLTHEEVAEHLNVCKRAVDYYCSGQRKPSQRVLLGILKLTQTNYEEIPF